VPEIAARAHAERLDQAVEVALSESEVDLSRVDAIAVTAGPGLIGGVLSGVMMAKGLAMGLGKPLIGVNHLAGHALTPRLTDGARFPYLLLLVSGGHCQILRVDDWNVFHAARREPSTTRRGRHSTRSRASLVCRNPADRPSRRPPNKGDPKRFDFPRPLLGRTGMRHVLFRAKDGRPARPGPAAARPGRADGAGPCRHLCRVPGCCGRCCCRPRRPHGAEGQGTSRRLPLQAVLRPTPPCANAVWIRWRTRGSVSSCATLALCTDNAAMIAFAGLLSLEAGVTSDLGLVARPRWPLDTRLRRPWSGRARKGPRHDTACDLRRGCLRAALAMTYAAAGLGVTLWARAGRR
jgi:N6-L-threonylcarbamoyladenine synthase